MYEINLLNATTDERALSYMEIELLREKYQGIIRSCPYNHDSAKLIHPWFQIAIKLSKPVNAANQKMMMTNPWLNLKCELFMRYGYN